MRMLEKFDSLSLLVDCGQCCLGLPARLLIVANTAEKD